jgi:hypothetical protein
MYFPQDLLFNCDKYDELRNTLFHKIKSIQSWSPQHTYDTKQDNTTDYLALIHSYIVIVNENIKKSCYSCWEDPDLK